jgi:hypothetical protein
MALRACGILPRDQLIAESRQLREHAPIVREILEKRRSPVLEAPEEQSQDIPVD